MSGAKQPIALLAGGHGHPVHPALVVIPVGSWVRSLVFDIASRVLLVALKVEVRGTFGTSGEHARGRYSYISDRCR